MSRLAPAIGRRARSAPRVEPIEWALVELLVMTLVALTLISGSLLTAFKIHYVATAGAFYEKLHPATYLVFAAFGLLLLRRGDPIGEIDRTVTHAKLLIGFMVCWGLLLLQCLVLRRPLTGAVDTFLLPVLFSVIVWNLTAAQKKPLVWVLHTVIWINIAVGYYEYFSGHRIVPLTVGGVPVIGEWRSTAFLGSPLSASAVVALYALMLILRPEICRPVALRIPAIVFSIGSLMAFGGRTALLSVLVGLACVVAVHAFRFIRGRRVALPAVMLTICAAFLLTASFLALLQFGTFDNMLNRFSSDKGSAHARIASLHLLTVLDWKELMFGTDPVRGSALQSMMGLQYGIESFWIACIVQYGAICTALISLGLGCFLIELLRRSDRVARVAVLFIVVDASSSVSFSSKNIVLATLVALIVVLLPRERSQSRTLPVGYARGTPAPARMSVIPAR